MAEFSEYLVMLNSDPNDTQALAELAGLADSIVSREGQKALAETRLKLLSRGCSETAVQLYDIELEHCRDESRQTELLLAKGQLVYDDLLDPDAGMECVTEALRISPDNQSAKDLAEHLEQVRVHWEQIVDKYVEEAEGSTETSLTTTLYRAAAETYARYRPGAQPVEEYLREALRADPTDARANAQMYRVLFRSERWEELRAHLTSRVEHAQKVEVRNLAWIRLAELALQKLNDSETAIAAMKNVIAADPSNTRAIKMLSGHYQEEENWPAAVTLYANALKVRRRANNPETEIDMLIQVGMLHWKRLEDADAAHDYFVRLAKLQPDHPVAIRFFSEYYVTNKQPGKLMQVYRQALKSVGSTSPERKRELTIELAQLSEGRMDNPEKAIDSWKSIYRSDPSNAEAVESLRRLYERTGKWNALLDLIKDEVAKIPEENIPRRVEGLLEIVAIYRDHLNFDGMVINTYVSILQLEPENIEVLDALAKKYEELGRANDLIGILGRKSKIASLPQGERAAILSEMASLWIDRFGNYSHAIKPLEELLEMDPGNADALARLKEIYTRRRQWRALIELLEKEASTLALSPQRLQFGDMARLAGEKLGDSKLAIHYWNCVLALPGSTTNADDIEPDAPLAYDALCQLYEREKRYLALVEMLSRKRAIAVTTEAALPVLERMGVLFTERLRAPAQAATVYLEILDLVPEHGKATRMLREYYASTHDYDALEALYARSNHWEDLIEVYFALSDKLQEPQESVALLERAAQVANAHVGNRDKVVRVYERLQSVSPEHLGAAHALVGLYREAGKWTRLLSTQEVILRQTQELDRLPLIDDIRALCEHQLSSYSLAFQWTQKAYEITPDDAELLSELQRLGAAADAWPELRAILDERIGRDISEENKLLLLRSLASMAENKLHDTEGTRRYLREVLALRPRDTEALDRLEQLAAQQHEWPALLDILQKRAELQTDLSEKLELLFKIANIEEEHVEDQQVAIDRYQQILALCQDATVGVDVQGPKRRVLRILVRLHEGRRDWSSLAAAHEMQLEHVEDVETESRLHFRLGELYQGPLEDLDAACIHYKQCFALTPSNQVVAALSNFLDRVEVAELLLPVFVRFGDHEQVAKAMEVLIPVADAERSIVLEKRLARLYEFELDAPEKAYWASARILLLDPTDSDNRSRLSTLARQLNCCLDLKGHWLAGLDACESLGCDATVKSAIALEIAMLCEDVLDDLPGAELAWRQLLALAEDTGGAYRALGRLLRQQQKWAELKTLLEEQIQGEVSIEERVAILWQLVELPAEVADVERAYLALIEADPGQNGAFNGLAKLYESQERWSDWEGVLGKRVELLGGASLAAANNQRAWLRIHKLDDIDGGIDLIEELLGRNREDGSARVLCRDLLDNKKATIRVAEILEPLYAEDALWTDLCGVLEAQLSAKNLQDPEENRQASALFTRLALLEETQLANPRGAMRRWQDVLAARPSSVEAESALLRLGAELGEMQMVCTALQSAAEKVDGEDVASKVRLIQHCAQISQIDLDDSAKATGFYEQLLALDTIDTDAEVKAAAELNHLYAAAGQYAKQVQILQQSVQWVDSVDDQCSILSQIALLQEDALHDSDAALATWTSVLVIEPSAPDALLASARLLEAKGDHRALLDVGCRQLALLQEEHKRADKLEELARLCEEKLSDPEAAIVHYVEALECRLDMVEEGENSQNVGVQPVLVQLTRLYRDSGRTEDVLGTLEKRIALSEGAKRTALVFEVGELYADELQDSTSAITRFSDVLRQDAGHPGALARLQGYLDDTEMCESVAAILAPLYESRGDTAALIALLQALCLNSGVDSRDTTERMRRIAMLQERDQEDVKAAWETMKQVVPHALSQADLLPDILAELARLSGENDALAELTTIYRDIADDLFDTALQRRLYLDIADLSRAVLKDEETARRYYQLVLQSFPDDSRALSALDALLRESEDFSSLYTLILQKSELSMDDLESRAALLLEAGQLCDEHLGRPDDAIVHWEQVLELTPDNRDVARKLQQQYRLHSRWTDLSIALERRLGFAQSVEEAVQLRFELAQILEEKLQDIEAAVESYGAVLGGDAHHLPALEALERLLSDTGVRTAVVELLEPIYIAQQNWPKLVQLYQSKLELLVDPVERLAITKYISRLHEDQLGDLEGAFHWLGRVFRECPSDNSIRMKLERLASAQDSWAELAEIYQQYVDEQGGESVEVLPVLVSLASIYNRRLERVEPALAVYRRILQIEDDVKIFAQAESMLERAQTWPELVGFYEEVVHSADNEVRREEIYFKIACTQENKLHDSAKAIDALRAILEINPSSARAINDLKGLLKSQQNWYELADVLNGQIEQASTDAQRVQGRLRLAELREDCLEDVPGAIEQYELILSESGDARALLALERLVQEPQYQEQLTGVLEVIYREKDWWQKLVVILDTRLAYTDDALTRGEILREIAALHQERGGDLGLALEALGKAWLEDVNDTDMYNQFVALGQSQGNATLLVEILEQGLVNQYDRELLSKTLLELAAIKEIANRDTDGAIVCLRRILDSDPDNRDALFELDRLLSSEEQWDDLIPIVERRAELARDVEDRLFLLWRVAQTHEVDRGDTAAAIEAYRLVLEGQEEGNVTGTMEALEALERLYRDTNNWSELSLCLLAKIELSEVEPARALRFELAGVYENELAQVYEAVGQLRAVLELDSTDLDALQGLSRLLRSESMWSELLDILDQQMALSEGQAKIAYCFAGAQTADRDMVDVESALERYANVLELDPTHSATREALQVHSRHPDSMERACAILEHVYRGESNHDGMVEIYERRISGSDDLYTRSALFGELAEHHEMLRSDVTAAYETWARAVNDNPSDESAQGQLERLASSRGNWRELIAQYETLLDNAVGGELEGSFANKVGNLYEESVGDLGRAAQFYERACSVEGEESAALISLVRVYERDRKYPELAETLRRAALASMEESEQAALLFRRGTVCEQHLENMEEAIICYRDVLERDPGHTAARGVLERLLISREDERGNIIGILEPLYEQDGNAAQLADLLRTKITIVNDAPERAQLYARLAAIAEQELGDQTRAMDALGGWLAEDPEAEDACSELIRVGAMLERYGEVAARLDDVASASQSDEVRLRLGLKSALLKLNQLEDLPGAAASLEAVLQIEVDNNYALEALQRVYRQLGNVESLAKIQWQRAELTYDPIRKRELLVECAHLRFQIGQKLDSMDLCVEAWRAVRDLEHGDAEALAQLGAIYRNTECWPELIEVLKTSAEQSDSVEVECPLRVEIAQIYSNILADYSEGIDAWRVALDLDPTCIEALDALESLHHQLGDFVAVQDILLRRNDIVETDPERIAVYLRLAQVAEGARSAPEDAVEFLGSILELDPLHPEASGHTERLLRSLERWHDVLEFYERRGSLLSERGDTAGEILCLNLMADVWEGPLDNPEEASEILEAIIERDPSAVSALTRLAKIYQEGEDWDRCGVVLERALAAEPTGADAADLYVRMGEVARNRDGDQVQADQYYGQALHCDGGNLIALSRIEESARAKEDWILVADMVVRRYLVTVEGEPGRREMLLEMAQLYGERLEQPERALPHVEEAYRANPQDPELIASLADLYYRSGRHQEAVPMYEALAKTARAKRRMRDVARYKQRLAGILAAQGHSEEAILAYEEAFRVDPTNVVTMMGLGALYMAKEDWNRAQRVYRSMVLQNIDASLGITKADVYFHLGEIALGLEQPAKAKDLFRRALGIDAEHPRAGAALAACG